MLHLRVVLALAPLVFSLSNQIEQRTTQQALDDLKATNSLLVTATNEAKQWNGSTSAGGTQIISRISQIGASWNKSAADATGVTTCPEVTSIITYLNTTLRSTSQLYANAVTAQKANLAKYKQQTMAFTQSSDLREQVIKIFIALVHTECPDNYGIDVRNTIEGFYANIIYVFGPVVGDPALVQSDLTNLTRDGFRFCQRVRGVQITTVAQVTDIVNALSQYQAEFTKANTDSTNVYAFSCSPLSPFTVSQLAQIQTAYTQFRDAILYLAEDKDQIAKLGRTYVIQIHDRLVSFQSVLDTFADTVSKRICSAYRPFMKYFKQQFDLRFTQAINAYV